MHIRRARVRIETDRHLIEGTLRLPAEGYRSRLTDFLNAHGTDFIPVTDAELAVRDGAQPLENHAYLAVAARHVVLVVELESLGVFDEAGEPPGEPVVTRSIPPPGGPDPGPPPSPGLPSSGPPAPGPPPGH
ncbi:MAG TPA: hypothetical protein VN213_13195 [Solirubrobacteraceae bacterium]|nr:hypothetical protein [Solirubrobacteraceae bacterium]